MLVVLTVGETQLGKKTYDLEKAVYRLLFVLANTLPLFDWRYIDLLMLHDQKVLMLLTPIDKCPMDF